MTGRREANRTRVRESIRLGLLDALSTYPGRRLDDVPVDEIAERAFCSTRTFFRHYPAKVDAAIAACRIDDQPDRGLVRRLVRSDPEFLGSLVVHLCNGDPTMVVFAAETVHEWLVHNSPEQIAAAAADPEPAF